MEANDDAYVIQNVSKVTAPKDLSSSSLTNAVRVYKNSIISLLLTFVYP